MVRSTDYSASRDVEPGNAGTLQNITGPCRICTGPGNDAGFLGFETWTPVRERHADRR
jgi:hypothetical protein